MSQLAGCWQLSTRLEPGACLPLVREARSAGAEVDTETVGFLCWGLVPTRPDALSALVKAHRGKPWRDVQVEFRDELPGLVFGLLTLGFYTQRTLVVSSR